MDGALSGGEVVGFAWTVILAFLRISTKGGVFPRPLAVEDAVGIMVGWLDSPGAVVVEPTGRHLAVLGSLLNEVGSGGNLVGDAHLAALAIEHGAGIVSFDADFGRYAGVRWMAP
jgi:toxin-antitoxin system PIN domain toxin